MKKLKIYLTTISIIILMILQFTTVNAADKSNNPMLKGIKINGNEIELAFEMFTTEYVITVGEDVEKVEIEATPDDANATVEIVGDTNLKPGRNVIEIRVTAEDGQAKQSYFLYITKGNSESANANLKEIKIKDYELAPAFDKNTINYAFEYPKNLEKVEIEVVPEDSEAKVEIIGNENLKDVTQNIEIKVTAKDGQTVKTYYLIAKKSGMYVESPEGNEYQETEEEEQKVNEEEQETEVQNTQVEIKNEEENENNVMIYILIGIMAVIIIGIVIKTIIEKRKTK